MNDISYEILDLFKKYGADKEGILKILEADSRPEVLYALSDIRRNLMDWMDFSGQEHVLQLGSDYGVITGLLAERCASVAVVDERDENLVVNQKMNEAHTNISYMKAADLSLLRLWPSWYRNGLPYFHQPDPAGVQRYILFPVPLPVLLSGSQTTGWYSCPHIPGSLFL